jgi:hypothetical protein
MPPITVEDAIAALELIDHPFYLFRNKVHLHLLRSYCALRLLSEQVFTTKSTVKYCVYMQRVLKYAF